MSTKIQQICGFLKSKYNIDVMVEDFSAEEVEIGDIRNKTIRVNTKSRSERDILFVIAHLFGHMSQFNDWSKYKELVEETEKPKPLELSEDFKTAFYNYEVEAYRIGKKLLEVVIGKEEADELDGDLQVYLDTDFETFWSYLTTGNKIPVTEFNQLLKERYLAWAGKYPIKLESVALPEQVNPNKDAVIY